MGRGHRSPLAEPGGPIRQSRDDDELRRLAGDSHCGIQIANHFRRGRFVQHAGGEVVGRQPCRSSSRVPNITAS